jgi:hypothetical protein
VQRKLRVVGGPARASEHELPRATTSYSGSGPDGFERLVTPARRDDVPNAWYRLGAQTAVDSVRMPHWGRIEIEADDEAAQYVFVTVLVTDRAGAVRPPGVALARADAGCGLSLTIDDQEATLHFSRGEKTGGSVAFGAHRPPWPLPTDVSIDPPLRTR